MIGKLTGKVTDLGEDWMIVDVNGVGYLVNMPSGKYLQEQSINIHIYTAVRENDISLWGFEQAQELSLFKLLLTVSGVGLKTAFALVAEQGVAKIAAAIISDDPAGLKIPGVGTKTAEKIIIDLRNKIENYAGGSDSTAPKLSPTTDQNTEVVEALVSLGYTEQDVRKALSKIEVDTASLSTEDLIKTILSKI